jgi:Nitroreductase
MGVRNKMEMAKQLAAIPRGYCIGALKRAVRFYNASSACLDDTSVQLVCRELRILTHTIEKGFSLPVVKKGFGEEKMKAILRYLDCYIKIGDFSYDHEAFTGAVMIAEEYRKKAASYDLNASFIDLSKYDPYIECKSGEVYGVLSFDNAPKADGLNFWEFAHARHSIRKFSDKPLPESVLREAVDLAGTAPSACNRQSVKVFHISDRVLSRKILDIQGGARGHSSAELLLLVSDLGLYRYLSEFELPYLDGGIYLMNLLYSLNYYQIGSCPLVWDDYGEQGRQLRELIEIPSGYLVLAIVQCGFYPEDGGYYAVSNRREADNCYVKMDGKEQDKPTV